MLESTTLKDMRKMFGIEIEKDRNLSQFGGMKAFFEYLEKAKFRQRLTDVLGDYGARSFLQLMIGVITGAEDMEEVARTR